ncbi:MAG: lytic murein transglycosylase B [Gammaproteobacteria bacterium]|nr:lytic murein transglycosylase B [Rhodocyclaceae bacterium]MBU3908467.1 lytic murein transglycosylase B [Gammaproteobacteria bacterium]MBU3988650.1 lytic murein transglycosylase B [Gammaproteobacteria bacterium]MBU4004495.1 lytic murein transglycosylase B [Gammaproteobacteria bacterium]MBU4021098.1 lytic murein transglycosylase B [Gammaproteobacteria bacterium]
MTRFSLLLCCLLLSPVSHAAPANNYAQRDDVQAFIAAMQARHGMDAERLTALFEKTRPIASVLKAIAPPADPGIRSWKNYRQRFIEPRRIAAGLDFWRKHQATLAKAQALSGVPAEIIVAIIGIETFYGKHLGRYDSFAALATLAFDYPPRADLFRRELEALLLLAQDEGRAPDSYRGSYAGAIGLPQFLPSSIRAYAVDFDRNGRIDLVGSTADAIGSAANFLKEHGWEEGGPIALKVGVTEGNPRGTGGAASQPLITEGILPKRRPAEMAGFGVDIPDAAPDAPAALIDLVTPAAPMEYWLGYQNFYVITRYNRSSFYAMTVFQFAQTLKERRLGYTATSGSP